MKRNFIIKLVIPTAHRTSQRPSGSMVGLRKMRLENWDDITWTTVDWDELKKNLQLLIYFKKFQKHSCRFMVDVRLNPLTSCRVSRCRRCSKEKGWRSSGTAAARHTAALSDDPDDAKPGFMTSLMLKWINNKHSFHLPEEKLELECFYSHIEKLYTGQPPQPTLRKKKAVLTMVFTFLATKCNWLCLMRTHQEYVGGPV